MEIDSAFLGYRAESLAIVLLTRHRDVKIQPTPPSADVGYDLIAQIAPKGVFSGRMFAVEIKAHKTLASIGVKAQEKGRLRLGASLKRNLETKASRFADLPFPLLFIVFDMETDAGYFGWLREPESTTGRLVTPALRTADLWSRDTHRQVVKRVDSWYKKRTAKSPQP
jgi:hypothetical protein